MEGPSNLLGMMASSAGAGIFVVTHTASDRRQQEAELAAHSLGLLRERIAGSESAQLEVAVAALEAELGAAREAVATAEARKAEAAAAAKVRPLRKSISICVTKCRVLVLLVY